MISVVCIFFPHRIVYSLKILNLNSQYGYLIFESYYAVLTLNVLFSFYLEQFYFSIPN